MDEASMKQTWQWEIAMDIPNCLLGTSCIAKEHSRAPNIRNHLDPPNHHLSISGKSPWCPGFPRGFPVDAPDSRGAAAAPGCQRRGAARRRAGGAVPELRPGGVAAAEGEGRDLGAAGGDGGGWGLGMGGVFFDGNNMEQWNNE